MNADATFPLTASQEQIWRGQALIPDSPLYNMVWRIDLRGALDAERFASAFGSMIAQTDAMRLRIWDENGVPVQCADRSQDGLTVLDLSADLDAETRLSHVIDADIARPFDLSQGVWRAHLIKLGGNTWVFALNIHHIATDAGSGALIWQRIIDAYADHAAADRPEYRTYTAAQTRALPDETTAYWAAATDRAPVAGPLYGHRTDAQATASRRVQVGFTSDDMAALDALSQDARFRSFGADLSRFTLLSTLFAAFLMRVKDAEIITLATPAHNRRSETDKRTVGLLIEMLPLSMNVAPDASLASQFKPAQSAIMGWMKHAQPGVIAHAPVQNTDAALNYIPTRFAPLAGTETEVTWLHAGHHDRGQDLRLHVHDFNGTGTLILELDIKSDVFAQHDAQAIADQFAMFLTSAIASPDIPFSHLPMVERGDAQASTALGTLTPPPQTVLAQFKAKAAQTPDATALVQGAKRLSYSDVNALSDRYAAGLAQAGVLPGHAVALFASRRVETVVAMIAVWKAGGFFVPIPSDTPPARLTAILDQLSPQVVLVDDQTYAVAPQGQHVIRMTTLGQDGPVSAVTHTGNCYAIFTSGSTGTPKGVEIGHDAFARYITWAAVSYGSEGPKSYPLCTAIGFDLTLTSIFTPLTTGGAVHIYPEPADGTDLSILEVFADDAVDVVKLTPAHLALAVQAGQRVSRIGTLIVGGEALSTQLCRNTLTQLGSHLTIANEYGPTEATVGCMIHRFDPAHDIGATVPIGRPADDVRLTILDGAGRPVPRGVAGELAIGGPRLATGYYGQPAMTAARFIADPETAGESLYMSGDRARMTAGGQIAYLGRADAQLKLSGVRVEAAEITGALLAVEGISDAAVHMIDPDAPHEAQHCLRCGLSSEHPDAGIDDGGICQICHDYEAIKDRADVYFKTPDALHDQLAQAKTAKRGHYDAIMLLSGGKDSGYAMYRLAEITKDVLVLTLDNGFISDEAKDNIRTMTADLGLDHRFLTTASMNAIFKDSLERFSNVCQGCFKTVYALSLKVARDEGIPAIVTGLSRGQFFETRLTTDFFAIGTPDPNAIDTMVQDARRAYHAVDDAVARELDTAAYIDDDLLGRVTFIDIYRYLDVPVSEIYAYLAAKSPWRRPSDTGRSTNCVINDLGIYVHKKREQFHNYALPYSWDVRLGHKTRSEAMAELDDDIDDSKIGDLMRQIGYDGPVTPRQTPALAAYIVESAPVTDAEVLHHLRTQLPREAVPGHIIRLPQLPLTSNGKIDTAALPIPRGRIARVDDLPATPPETDMERLLVGIFAQVLGLGTVGVTSNFYDMGGDSIAAIQISTEARKSGLTLEPTAVFQHQTIRDLAVRIDTPMVTEADDDAGSLLDLDAEDAAALETALARMV